MRRREFLSLVAGAAVAGGLVPLLPSVAPESYVCDCGLVTYVKQPEGHFAAKYFGGQRFTYALFRQHEHLHRKMAEGQPACASSALHHKEKAPSQKWWELLVPSAAANNIQIATCETPRTQNQRPGRPTATKSTWE